MHSRAKIHFCLARYVSWRAAHRTCSRRFFNLAAPRIRDFPREGRWISLSVCSRRLPVMEFVFARIKRGAHGIYVCDYCASFRPSRLGTEYREREDCAQCGRGESWLKAGFEIVGALFGVKSQLVAAVCFRVHWDCWIAGGYGLGEAVSFIALWVERACLSSVE